METKDRKMINQFSWEELKELFTDLTEDAGGSPSTSIWGSFLRVENIVPKQLASCVSEFFSTRLESLVCNSRLEKDSQQYWHAVRVSIFEAELGEMLLMINSDNRNLRTISKWRLKIGR
jgi:hypothetical protein